MNLVDPWTAQCMETCRRAKFIGEDTRWIARMNHDGSIGAQSSILDANFVTIPGLSFHGEAQSRRHGAYHKYGLLYKEGGRGLRVFMLEVMPQHVRSHTDHLGDIFGPHIQMGDERGVGASPLVRHVRSKLDAASLNGWIDRFKRHARVADNGDNRLHQAFEDDLFGIW